MNYYLVTIECFGESVTPKVFACIGNDHETNADFIRGLIRENESESYPETVRDVILINPPTEISEYPNECGRIWIH